MARNKFTHGEINDYVIAATALKSGDPVAIGTSHIGIAQTDAAVGDQVSVAVWGVYTLPKVTGTGTAIAQGDTVYLTTAGNITTTATGNTYAGYAWMAAATTDTTVNVKLIG